MTLKHTFSFIIGILFTLSLFSQEMEVIRTKSVDRALPVTNVFVDASNKIWVGNTAGLYLVSSPENSTKQSLAATEWSLLQTHDGNHDVRLAKEELFAQMGSEGQAVKNGSDRITAATYQESKDLLWVGTSRAGLFEFKTKPALRLVKRHHTGNSKIPDNQVNTMLLDAQGKLWVGTYGGAFIGEDGNWKVEEKGFSFSAFAQNGAAVWAMGDNLLWRVDSRGKWEPKDFDPGLMEGDVADIAFDQEGRLWVVSQIVARFDPATEKATVFGPAIGFTSQDVHCIAVDQNNGVWIGTNDKGLYLVQKASTLYVSAIVSKKLECNQPLNIAAITIKAEGGQPPYSYQWASGQTTQNLSGLGPGRYEVTVKDSQGKTGRTEAFIDDPNISIQVKKIKDVTLNEPTYGAAEVVLEGSAAGYKFSWSNGETSKKAQKLNAGKYTVTATDNFGCQATAAVEISKETAELAVTLEQIEQIVCPGTKTGGIRATVTGGQPPYNYDWGIGILEGYLVKGLKAGNYRLKVTDAKGATTTAEMTLVDPPALVVKIIDVKPASTSNEDGRATVEVSGGSGSVYKYKWSNGETGNTATRLAPGEQSVTVTDEVGCEKTASVTITENISALSVSVSQKSVIKCAGSADASLEATVEGGKGPFRFNWSGGGTSQEAIGLLAGTYTVTVTDATASTAVKDFTIKEPKELTVSANVKSPASTGQADGKAVAKASGGTGNYRWAWSNGETSDNAEKLGPGSHSVTVTDENGCTATAAVEVKEDILELNVELTLSEFIKCAGASDAALRAEITGGKGPFKLNWSPSGLTGESPSSLTAGDYKVTVTDAVGTTAMGSFKISEPKSVEASINVDAPASTGNKDGRATVTATGGTGQFSYKWSNGETSKTSTGLAPGEHTVTVTDGAGCTATATVNITENVLAMKATAQLVAPIKCAGDQSAAVAVKVEGGKGPFEYTWNDPALKGDSPSGMKAGQYTLTITDATGQKAQAAVTINEPKPLTVELVSNRPSTTEETKNGRATLKVDGGTPNKDGESNYTYRWDNGETGPFAESLAGGDHSVTVTDVNGCTASLSFFTKIRIIPELSADNLRTGETIKLNNIYFQPDSTKMEPSSLPTVDELYEFLLENKNLVIEVGGHTNGIPSHAYCDNLSTERAKSVAQYLVDKGIPAKQLRYKGYGKRNPVATNTTEEGRAKNQRVEIKVLEYLSEGG